MLTGAAAILLATASAQYSPSQTSIDRINAAAQRAVDAMNEGAAASAAADRSGSGSGQDQARYAGDAQLEEDISNAVVNYLSCVGPSVEDLTRFGIASESGESWYNITGAASDLSSVNFDCSAAISSSGAGANTFDLPGRLMKTSQFSMLRSPFPVQARVDEGGDSDNKYGWGADYSEDCGVGVVIHSGGTVNTLINNPTIPTVTFRDANGDVFWSEAVPDLESVGLRTAKIIGCDDGAITFLTAPIVLGPATEILKVTVDTSKDSVDIETFVDVPGRSVRTIELIDECTIAYAVLTSEPAANNLYVADICDANKGMGGMGMGMGGMDLKVKSFNCPTAGDCSVWDFEIKGDRLYIVTTTTSFPAGRYTITPHLMVADVSDLTSNDDTFNGVYFTINGDIETAAYSIEPITSDDGEERVLVCGLSGFLYYSLAGLPREDQRLGEGQECFVCNPDDLSCNEISIPSMTNSVAYVWRVESCGPYLFAGTLDLAGTIFNVLRNTIADVLIDEFPILEILADEDAPENIRKIFFTIVEEITSFVIADIYEDLSITRADMGFDLYYMRSDDLFDASPQFVPVTIDGFRRVQASVLGFAQEGNYDPTNRVGQDGVRNLICHPGELDKKGNSEPTLIVATAAYYDDDSMTFEVSLGEFNTKGKGSDNGGSGSLSSSAEVSAGVQTASVFSAVGLVALAALVGYRAGKRRTAAVDEEKIPLMAPGPVIH